MVKRCMVFALCLVSGSMAFSQNKPSPEQLRKGEPLYISCIHCHGTTAGALADPLQRNRKVRAAEYLYNLMQKPKQFAGENKTAKKAFEKSGLQMLSFDYLSRKELKTIFDYLDSQPYDPKNYRNRKKN